MSDEKKLPKRRFKQFLNTPSWEQRKLTDISKTFIGLVTTMTTNYREEGTLLIRNSDIRDNKFIFSEKPIYLDSEFAKSNESRKLKSGDVVTVHTGDIGTSAVVEEDIEEAIGFATINTRPDINYLDSHFLSTYFNTESHKKYAISVATGDGRSNYNIKDFNKLMLYMPSVNEQKAIAEFIRRITNLITLHQRKLNKLEKLKKAYLEELFPTGEQRKPTRRFKEFNDDWEQRKLGDVIERFEYGLNAAAIDYDGVHKYIRITDIDDVSHKFLESNLTTPKIDFQNTDAEMYKLKEGDILFARTGASVGKTYLYDINDGDLYFAGFLIRGRVSSSNNSKFVYQNTLTENYDLFIKITSQRSGQPGVNSKEYAEFKLYIPSKEEQDKISSVLTDFDNLITLHQRKLKKLKKLKEAYLDELFV